jgi:tetratricopeptide (TPR) repeat protein
MEASPTSTLFVAVLVAGLSAAQAPLPQLSLDSYPPAARDQIGRALRKAEIDKDQAESSAALGRVLQAWNELEPAHQAYTRALLLAPETFEWQYLDGVVLQRLTRHAEAAERFARAAGLRSSYIPARVKLAESLLEAGRLDDSERLFRELTRERAAEPAAEFGLGRIEAARGRHAAAIVHLERATALFPQYGAAYYALALSYRALGRRDDAQRALARQAENGTRWPGIDDPILAAVADLREDAAALVQKGVKAADAGNLQAAIAAHEAALERDPEFIQAHVNLISLYARAGNRAKAEEHYNAVVRRGVNLDEAHYNFGVLLGMQNDWNGAAEAYRKALAVDPLDVKARNNLGQALEHQQNLQGALDEYRRAVDAQPTFRIARFNVARMLMAMGRADDAIRELERTLEPRDSETPRYLFAFAMAQIKAGHVTEGVAHGEQARELAKQYAQPDLVAAIDRELAKIKR